MKYREINFERTLGYHPESIVSLDFEDSFKESSRGASDAKPSRLISGIATVATIDDNYIEVTPAALRKAENDLLVRSTILENHDFKRSVGKVLAAEYDPSQKALLFRGFVSSVEDDVWTKVKEGVLDKFSVSWRSMKYEETYDEKLERQKIVVHEMRIYEVSLVSVPALAEAGMTGWMERALTSNGFDPEAVDERRVIPFKSAKKAPKNRKWDKVNAIRRLRRRAGGVSKDKIDWKSYSEGFAYVADPGTSFGDYKFPVRDVSGGNLVAVWHALTNAVARLANAKIPSEDKKKLAKRFIKEYEEIWGVPDDEVPPRLKELSN
jgi:HK97 family phage prohead protease